MASLLILKILKRLKPPIYICMVGRSTYLLTLTSNLLARHTTLGEVDRWHLLNGLVGLLGLLGCWTAARWLAGDAAAFWAASLFGLHPWVFRANVHQPQGYPPGGWVHLVTCLLNTS